MTTVHAAGLRGLTLLLDDQRLYRDTFCCQLCVLKNSTLILLTYLLNSVPFCLKLSATTPQNCCYTHSATLATNLYRSPCKPCCWSRPTLSQAQQPLCLCYLCFYSCLVCPEARTHLVQSVSIERRLSTSSILVTHRLLLSI